MSWPLRNAAYRWSVAAAWAYLSLLGGWLLLYLFSGDSNGVVGMVTALAQNLFLPLPLVALLAWKARRVELRLGAALGALVFAALWGRAFLPKQTGSPQGGALSVLTFNVLGREGRSEPLLKVLRAENADIVCLQELTPPQAEAIRAQLQTLYPYQYLAPRPGVSGMGVLSKTALLPETHPPGDEWVGDPQAFTGLFAGRTFTLVNFHMPAYNTRTLETLTAGFRQREAMARILAAFVQARGRPAIACGDANASPLNEVHRVLQAGGLQDAWEQAGWGLGNTFPSRTLYLLGVPVLPQWSTRIDYVLHTPEWQALQARTARPDGVSDHRGVWVQLGWR